MKHLLAAALLFSTVAFAAAPSPALTPRWVVAQADTTEEGEAAEEEETEEEGGEEAAPAPAPATPPADAPVAEAGATPPPARQSSGEEQKLVHGAPLFNPNVAVHIVEKKRFADRGKHEVVLYPAAYQVNGKFTQHAGTAASYVYHLQENFALQLTPQYNWFSSESAFNEELVTKVREQAQAATSLLLVWGLQGGVEVTPIYGKFAFYEDQLLSFGLVINAGAGLGDTRHQLKPVTTDAETQETRPATYGSTGIRFLGSVGGGFRVQFGDRFAIRLEVKDLVYTARVDQVNGCTAPDLQAMDQALRAGRAVSSANVSGGCDVGKFEGIDENSGYDRSRDVNFALDLVEIPSSDVLNNISFYAGVAYLF